MRTGQRRYLSLCELNDFGLTVCTVLPRAVLQEAVRRPVHARYLACQRESFVY